MGTEDYCRCDGCDETAVMNVWEALRDAAQTPTIKQLADLTDMPESIVDEIVAKFAAVQNLSAYARFHGGMK